jgi:pimeloyl-ACP methyl ester carboxylesterase
MITRQMRSRSVGGRRAVRQAASAGGRFAWRDFGPDGGMPWRTQSACGTGACRHHPAYGCRWREPHSGIHGRTDARGLRHARGGGRGDRCLSSAIGRNARSLEGLAKNLRQDSDGRYRWHWDPAFIDGPRNINTGAETVQQRLAEAARRLSIPVLLVRGQQSELVREEAVAAFREMTPHAEFVDVSGAGHMVAGDRNDAFNDAVVGFLDRLEGRAKLTACLFANEPRRALFHEGGSAFCIVVAVECSVRMGGRICHAVCQGT